MMMKISLTVTSPNGNPHPMAVYNVLTEVVESLCKTIRDERQNEFPMQFITQYEDKCELTIAPQAD
jgi:hypothetical protein